MPAEVCPLSWLKVSTVKSDGNSPYFSKFLAQLLIAGGNKFVVQVAVTVGGEHEEMCWQQSLWLSCAG